MRSVFKHVLVLLLTLISGLSLAQTELCNNGVDDDGDGIVDCSDSDCQYAANIERGCNCADGIDNDGDGGADVSDAECAGFYGLTFVGGEDGGCSITPDPGTGTFEFVNPSNSGQNTVDTQSKIAVGDVNCDGIPDVVTTSKWNQTLRVVATSDNQADGSDKGDIIQDFKTPGSKIFPAGGFYFELEVLIADIDGSCPAEIYSIVSKRKTANSEPEGYYLVGFRANASPSNSSLVPLFDAIPLGPDRPGEITIADMDCDNQPEIILKDQVYDAATGALLADGNVGNWNTGVTSAPVAVDIIEGGNLEVVVGNLILSYPDMTVIADMNALGGDQWFPKEIFDANEYGFDNFSSTSVADMNGDGNLDVVLSGALGSKNGETAVFFWDVANGTVSSFSPPDPTYADGWIWGTSRPNLGDIDGDGSLEITFVAGNQLFALEVDPNTGALSQKWVRTINDSRSGVVATTVFDFDNDGSPEVVYRDSQQLVIIDGETGQNVLWSTACQSHTMTEGPVIADVNGDGATDLCTTCNTNNSFNIEAPIQQQALGELRCFFSQNNSWLPTRGVWNQSGYFVTNIADDLSVPCPRFDMTTSFSDDTCDNGVPGPQRPFNTFLNQVPSLGANGCPFYPSPDIAFVGHAPGELDPSDPNYFPAVEVIPPTCGDLGVEVLFNIINNGSLVISANVDVSFWEGNPTVAVDPVTGEPATFLHADVLTLTGLEVGDTITTAGVTFDYSGSPTTLYIVLNDDGTEFPVDTTSTTGLQECNLDNNIYAVDIIPDPFTVEIENIADNFKCDDTAPDTGEIRAVVTQDGVEVSDYSLYGFQWYYGSDTTNAYPDPEGSTDWLTELADTTYTVVVTNLEKGCSSLPVTDAVLRQGVDPVITVLINSHQTHCFPPNGQLEVTIEGGLAGYSFQWYDNNLNPIGVTGPIASDLTEGEWIVDVSKSGCTERVSETIGGPTEPDVVASVVRNVSSCTNLGSGKVTAQAFINTVLQDSANYVFDWYFYNNATGTLGSILPPETGSGPTRSGLDIGFYAVIATEIVSGCESSPMQIVEITDQRTYPELIINEIAPQTSCDPTNPNGILEVVISNGGVIDDPLNYTIEWFRGQNTLPANLHTNTSGANGEVAEGIEGGGIPYTVKVTNANNCFSTTDTIVTQDVNVPVLTLSKLDNSTCDPSLASSAYNGQITASVTFKGNPITLPDPQYEFTWYNGTTTSDPVIATADATAPVLSELPGGYYTVEITRTDLFCVSAPVTIEILDVEALPVIGEELRPSTNCPGGADNGEIEITTIDGVAPGDYTINWYDGNIVKFDGGGVRTPDATGVLYSGIPGSATYTVEVINNVTGCINTESYTLPDNSILPTFSLEADPNSVCDPLLASSAFTGEIRVVSLNDLNFEAGQTYTYTFTNIGTGAVVSQATATLSNLEDGIYEVTVGNDQLACTSDPVQVIVPFAPVLPTIDETFTPSTNCLAADNGAIEITAIDGVAPNADYTINWYDGNVVKFDGLGNRTPDATGPIYSGIPGGTNYTVEVINNITGCINTESYTLSDNSALPTFSLESDPNSVCDATLASNAFTGEIRAVALNDVNFEAGQTYTYTFTNLGTGAVVSQATETLSNLEDGDYQVTVENDQLGCLSDPVQVVVGFTPALPVITEAFTPSTNCSAGDNGAIEITAVDGVAPSADYTINWYDGNSVKFDGSGNRTPDATGTIYSSIPGGTNYTVEVINNLTGCINTEAYTLADNSALPTFSLESDPNSVCDAALASSDFTGEIRVVALTDVNFVAGHTYTYTFTNTGTGAVVSQATATLPNLEDGTYEVTVENDQLGCTSDPVQVVVGFTPVLPTIVEAFTPSTNCTTADNGAIEITTIDGVAPSTDYTINWYDGNSVKLDGSGNRLPDATGAIYGSIPGGANYTVEVINNITGCINTESYTLADDSELPTFSLESDPNSVCDAALASSDFTGEIRVVALTDVNFVAGHTYTYTFTNTGTGAVVSQATATLPNLEDGTYEVTVENDQLGCTSDPVQVVVGFTPVLPTIVEAFTPSTNCTTADNGAIEITTIDGVAPSADYDINWYDGNSVKLDGSGNRLPDATGAIYSGIPGGANYTVEIINNITGCINTESYTLADNSELPTFSLESDPNSVCDAALASSDFTGEIRVVALTDVNFVAGHTYTYTFTNTGTGAIVSQSTATLSNLEDGTYEVTVGNDQLGCTSDPVQVVVGFTPVLPTIVEAFTPSTNCTTADNGAIEITTIDGVAPSTDYTINWYDGNSVKLDGSGNRLPDATGAIYSGIPGGANYTVEVINNITGCINTESYTLADDSALPIVTLSKVDNTICDSGIGFSGSVTAAVSYKGSALTLPDANYVFTWYDGTTTSDPVIAVGDNTAEVLAGLEGGFYTVTVNNVALGCTSDPVTIEVVDVQYFPDISIAVTPQTFCVGLSGELLATIDETSIGGGNPADPNDYTFTWYEYDNASNTSSALSVGVVGGVNGEEVTQLPEGYYRLEVLRTSTGCINNEIVFLPENITIPDVTLTKDSDLTTCGSPNGQLQAVIGGVQVGYTFHWYHDNDAPDEDFVIANANTVNVDNGLYTDLIPGDYTVVAVHNTTGCISPMQTERILNITNDISIDINFDILPTDCNTGNGQMTANPTVAATVTDPDADFTYEWYEGGPTNADPVDFFTNPPVFDPAVPFSNLRTVSGLTSGTFTVVVTYNATGCSELRTIFLPFIDSPVVTPTVTNSTECPYVTGNGEVTIDIDASGVTAAPPGGDLSGAIDNDNFTLNFYSGANADVLMPGFPIELDPPTYTANQTITVATALAPGFYTIELIEDYTGNNCSMFEVIEVAIDALPPVVSLVGTVNSNTACDLNQADGEFTVDVSKDPEDNAVGTTYDLDISPDPNNAYPIVGQPVGAYAFTQLPPDTYTVTVTASTGCSTTRNFTVPDAPTVSEIVDGDVIITDADLCTPSGSIEITNISLIGVGPDNLDDFEFTWYDDAGLTNIVFQAQGDATAANGGEVLDNVNYASMGPGTYWVVAEKTTGVGAGCFSAPFQSVVPDVSVDPQIALEAFSNTSCTDAAPEGSITIDMTTASGPGVGATYTYNITGPAGYSNILNGQTGTGNIITGLDDGTYTVLATNETTGCSVTGVITIPVNQTPIIITDATAIDQELCTPDGRAEVVGVSIDGGVTNSPLNEFTFEWFKDTPGAPGTGLQNGGVIIGDSFLDVTNYPSIEAGTYYVVATRLTGFSPGAGCASPPARVDIMDTHVNPEISLAVFSNTSCSELNPEGSITIDASTPSGPGVGATYTYYIAGPDNYADTLTVQSGAGNTITNLTDSTYTITAINEVTGCSVTGDVTISINKTPIIITDATALDQELCTPDGRAEVVGVSIDGGVTNRPLNEFTFEWFKDNPGAPGTGLQNGGVIIGDSFLDVTNYPSIEAGTYYVVATRLTGFSPGAGCASPPARVDIMDTHVNPELSLAAFSNTSCSELNPEGSITIDASTPSGPGVGATYTYYIAGPDNYADTLTVQSGAGNTITNLTDSTYTITAINEVTGCSVTGDVTISINKTPIIITDATALDQELCTPDGRAEVVGVSIDGGVTNRPLNEFTFEWFKDTPGAPGTGLQNGGVIIGDSFLDVTNYPSIEAGTYYVVATRLTGFSPGAGCASPPARVDIMDTHVNPELSLAAFSNTSCSELNPEGSITIDASTPSGPGVGATYTYYIAGPDNYTDTLTVQSGAGNTITNLTDSTYTITAINEVTGCSVIGKVTISLNQTPIIITAATATDQELCTPDGRAEVTGVSIDGGATNRPLNEFTYLWYKDSPNSTELDNGGVDITEPFLDITNYPDIESGTYYVVATRLDGFSPGAGCASPPARVDIIDNSVDPQISLQGFANTSCTEDYEGSIVITMTTPSGPGVGATYTYYLAGPDNYADTLTAQTGIDNTVAGLNHGQYTIIAINEITSCDVTGSITLLPSQTPIIVTNATATDQQLCQPDGRIDVTGVSIDGGATNRPLNEFTFEWYKDSPGAPGTGLQNGGVLIQDPFLDITNYPGIEAAVYYVVAYRRPNFTPGAGCSSPPARVEIIDSHVNPQVTLAATVRTACDDNVDGTLVIDAADPSGPGVGATFTYNITVNGDALAGYTGSTNTGNSGIGDVVVDLDSGLYVVEVINEITGCSSTATKRIQYKPEPIDVVTVDHEDQDICYADGRIEVTVISPTAPANYTFDWYRDQPYSTVLSDSLGNPISGAVLEAGQGAGQYPFMGAGTYYVVATRLGTNAPGSGCPSPPFRVDVEDISTDPVPALSFKPNTACDSLLANGTINATVQEQNGSNTDPYTFTWTSTSTGSTVPSNDVGNTSELTGLLEDIYTVEILNEATGCIITSSIEVTLDQPQSQPNIIKVHTEDPTDCNGSGTAEVRSISIGGGPLIENYDTLNTNFTYEWYKDDIDTGIKMSETGTYLDSLEVGTYYVIVTSLITGCESIPKEVNILVDDIIYPVISITQTKPQVVCNPTLPFSAELFASVREANDSVDTYEFEWFYNGGSLPFGTPPSVDTDTTSTLSQLPAGEYEVQVLNDSSSCIASAFFIISDESDRHKPLVKTSSQPLTFCWEDGENGSVLVADVEFLPNYPFAENYRVDWYIGINPDLTDSADYKNMESVSNLPDGDYTIKVTDYNTGCVVSKVQNIKDERQRPVITITESSQTTCPPYLPNGVLTATVGGRVGGYSFEWFSGSTAGASGTGLTTRNRLIGYPAGTYTVRVIDKFTGCDEEETRDLKDAHLVPPIPTPELLSNVTSCIDPDGKVTVTVNGETQGYDFLWYEGASVSGTPFSYRIDVLGLDIGTYTVTATDATTGCVSEGVPIDVGDERLLPEFTFEAVGSKCDENTGQATIAITNNTIVSTVEWSDANTGFFLGLGTDLNGVPPGEYQAVVTTFLGCESTDIVEIGTVITNYNLVSSDGDGINDNFQIDCITNFPNNNVRIYNRAGVLVYEIDGYNNADRAFTGIGQEGLYSMGDQLPNGTYFYLIDKGDGSEIISGFLELIR